MSKHITAEDLDELAKNDKKKVFCVVIFKQNCKNKEHLTSQCPFDPNIRSLHDPVEELERLQKNENHRLQKMNKVNKTSASFVVNENRMKFDDSSDSSDSESDNFLDNP